MKLSERIGMFLIWLGAKLIDTKGNQHFAHMKIFVLTNNILYGHTAKLSYMMFNRQHAIDALNRGLKRITDQAFYLSKDDEEVTKELV